MKFMNLSLAFIKCYLVAWETPIFAMVFAMVFAMFFAMVFAMFFAIEFSTWKILQGLICFLCQVIMFTLLFWKEFIFMLNFI